MVLLLLGAPGSGKGTISNILSNKKKFKVISTGDLLRAEVKSGSQLGKKLDSILKSGQLVSADIVNNLVKSKLLQCKKQKANVILDGYPRSVEQAKFLDTFVNIDRVVNLEADKKTLVKRLTGRWLCSKCGANYNVNTSKEFHPKKKGICNKCNSKLYQRADDNVKTISKRLDVYETTTSKLINFYKKKKNLISINSIKFSPEHIAKKAISK